MLRAHAKNAVMALSYAAADAIVAAPRPPAFLAGNGISYYGDHGSGAQVMMTAEPNHQEAFKFLRGVAIDQHINARNRWDDLIPVIQKYPELLGIGLSEGTAIVVTGDTFEVMGKWKVAIHDNTRLYQPWEKPFFVLSAGADEEIDTRSAQDGAVPGVNPVG